jgi:predicted transcriptional regulator
MFSVHGHVLILVARDPDAHVTGIAAQMNLSVAAVGRVLADLVASNLVAKIETGTCTRHVVTNGGSAVGTLTAPRSVAAVTRLYGRTA